MAVVKAATTPPGATRGRDQEAANGSYDPFNDPKKEIRRQSRS